MSKEPTIDIKKKDAGRPLLFEEEEELRRAIQSYFDHCDPHIEERMVDAGVNQQGRTIWAKREVMTEQKPYGMTSLAVWLNTSRRTIKNYGERERFFHTIAWARDKCESYWEGRLDSPYSSGAKYALSNNYPDWNERQVLAGDPNAPLGNPMQPLTTDQLRHLADEHVSTKEVNDENRTPGQDTGPGSKI